MLQTELEHRGTRWSPDQYTFEQVQALRRERGLPGGITATRAWLAAQMKAGRVKASTGTGMKDDRLVRQVRYQIP